LFLWIPLRNGVGLDLRQIAVLVRKEVRSPPISALVERCFPRGLLLEAVFALAQAALVDLARLRTVWITVGIGSGSLLYCAGAAS
jgi:hypothetical protein